ncbi:MAG: hypothetical protein ABW321_10550 [Polyangiales bacterium]
MTDALGQLQYSHSYLYYEISQQGDTITVNKGLQCGDDAIGVGDFAVTADFKASWPSVVSRSSFQGRAGRSAAVSGGCQVELEKWYTVRGATIPHYQDPAVPMPSAEEMASGSTPGWEDWDEDGNPGITGMVSGVVTGKIFVAPRQWTALAGLVPDVSTLFKLPLDWNQEANVMAYDGTPLLGSEAARAADKTLHFAEFARLAEDQATGDDQAICSALVALAPMLTPAAAGL